MFKLTCDCDFKKTTKYLSNLSELNIEEILKKYGRKGVEALRDATPVSTGKTAASWKYKVKCGRSAASLVFENTNIQNGVPVVILIQYGHGTKNGGYVEGRDFINPATAPIFDAIAEEAWAEIKRRRN